MATVKDASGVATHEAPSASAAPTNKDEAKKAVGKYENESGLDANHLTRAASEYMTALRPQPDVEAQKTVLTALVEKDDKGELKHKCKKSEEVPAIVDGLLKPAA